MNSDKLQYRALLQDDLHTVESMMVAACESMPSPIGEPIVNLIRSGGKRLRPALVLLSAGIYGADHEKALSAAAATEMLHTATLVHDDLIDNAIVRRGVATLNTVQAPAATVLAGDAVFAYAAQLISDTASPRLIHRFSETLATICHGEINQLLDGQNGKVPTLDAYYRRIHAKTASLFALCSEAGPILADRSEAEVAAAHRFGVLLGEAFQIADDVLDVMSEGDELGKPAGMDLRHGLVTLPILRYIDTHTTDPRLLAVLSGTRDEMLLTALLHDLRRSDAAAWSMAQARDRISEAVRLLDNLPESPWRSATENVARFAVRRQY